MSRGIGIVALGEGVLGRAVDAAAAKHALVRGVDNGVALPAGEVAPLRRRRRGKKVVCPCNCDDERKPCRTELQLRSDAADCPSDALSMSSLGNCAALSRAKRRQAAAGGSTHTGSHCLKSALDGNESARKIALSVSCEAALTHPHTTRSAAALTRYLLCPVRTSHPQPRRHTAQAGATSGPSGADTGSLCMGDAPDLLV